MLENLLDILLGVSTERKFLVFLIPADLKQQKSSLRGINRSLHLGLPNLKLYISDVNIIYRFLSMVEGKDRRTWSPAVSVSKVTKKV